MVRNRQSIGIGAVSLLVMFSVLCLTIFAVLALSTALNERELAQRSAESTSAYYGAEVRCAAILDQLRMGRDACALGVRETPDGLVFSQAIDEQQALLVVLRPDDLSIAVWQVVYTADWVAEDGFTVWDGT